MGSALKKQKVSKEAAKPTKKEPVTEQQEDVSSAENDSEMSELEDLEDLDEDDEVDVADISSDNDSEQESDGDEEDDDSFPKKKKLKNTDDGSESFATAFNAIIGSRLKAHDRKEPILARNKTAIKKLESDKLEAKAKRALLGDKADLHDKHRVKNLLPSADDGSKAREIIEKERKLKKVAQKGVVRLFNAVLSTQVETNEEIGRERVGQTRKEELMNEISKEKFLDLVQAAGQS